VSCTTGIAPEGRKQRRDPFLLAMLWVLGFAMPVTADAQPAARMRRVGLLCPITCTTAAVRTFRRALAALGYREGANIVFEYRSAAGDLKRLPDLAGDLVRRRVDVIFTTWGTAPGLAAKRATTTIPIVVGSVGDPVAAGLVKSLSRPGGNVTAIASLALQLEGKRLQFLMELMPGLSRAAVFRDTANPYSVLAMKQQRRAAAALGLKLTEIEVDRSSDVGPGFSAIRRQGLNALCIHAYIPVLASLKRIVALAAKYHIVAVYPLRDYVDAGGLMSYGASLDANARRAAADVAKILRGAKPADLPVEQSTRVELVVNLKAAKGLGLTIPPSILARADEVIE
jgi:ABC-type uncharacterized transport system substrate-binding protein